MVTKSAISIKSLNKTYHGFKNSSPKNALIDINLEIPQGSFFGLLGPNGAGKSTLINILAGLTKKTSGKVIIDGIDVDEDARASKFAIGVVPQEVVLDPFFSVRETLDYYAGYYSVPQEKRRTQEIIDALHLSDKSGVNSRRLSGGMKRRVLIAKALVHSPKILVLDEPTAGVDVELRTQLWEYVRNLNKNGTTILLTTHYLEEAEELCDKIAIINHGKIIANENKKSLMGALDQKQLIIKFSDKIHTLPETLKKYAAEILDENSISISYRKSDDPIGKLIEIIKKEGLNITDLSTKEPDLEDVFKHLVNQKS